LDKILAVVLNPNPDGESPVKQNSTPRRKIKKPRLKLVPIRPSLEELPGKDTPYIHLLNQEQKTILERIAKKLLAPQELQVYSMCNNLFGEGINSHAAIGRYLGIKKQTVGQTEKRAIQKINEHYKTALIVIKAELFSERIEAHARRQGHTS
jgi:hypothetical protein